MGCGMHPGNWPNFEWMDVMVFWMEREREREMLATMGK